jgi:CRP-like cAMP-binding protein
MLVQARQTNAFLSDLSAEEFAIVRMHLAPLEMRAGDRLHRLGSPVEDVVFPNSGLIAMTLPLLNNPRAAAALVGRDGLVGAIPAAASAPASCDAEVHIDGQAVRLSAAAFRAVLDQSPAIRRRLARYTNAMLAELQQTALCHANHPVEARICRWLLEIHVRCGDSRVPLTQSTLAQMLGVRRTTVTLVAGRLEAAGVLNCRRGYMQIVNHLELERHSCECSAHVRSYMAKLGTGPSETPAATALASFSAEAVTFCESSAQQARDGRVGGPSKRTA